MVGPTVVAMCVLFVSLDVVSPRIYARQWLFHASGSSASFSTWRGRLAGGDVGDGDLLEHAPQRRPHRDPHLGQPLGRAVVARVISGRMSRTAASGPSIARMTSASVIELRGPRQPRAAVGTPVRGDDPGPAEVGEDVVEEVARDGLGLGDAVGLHQLAVGGGELQHRPHRVVGLGRHLHAARPSTRSRASRNDGGVGVTRFSTRLSANTAVRTGSAAGGNHGIR